MTRFIPDLKLILLLITVLAAPYLIERQDASAQDNPAETAPVTPVIDPVADKMLKAMSKTLSSAKAFTFTAAINFDQLIVSGQQIQYGGTAGLSFQRPDKAYAEFSGDLNERKVWYTGKEVTVLDVDKKFYGTLPVPSNIDDAMDKLMVEYGFTLPLSDVVVSDPYKAFVTNVAAGVVIGDSKINGESCKHLAFVEKYIDWQIWISNGVQALPCKLVITYKTLPGGPQYSAVFSDWVINP
ncbi:MAG: DUF2092 domain-containing protein, partial [Thermodesulfobacteriota bacterium]